MFRFENESYLYWTLFAVVIFVIGWAVGKKRYANLIRVFKDQKKFQFLSTYSLVKSKWKLGLSCLCLVLMAISLARPQMGQGQSSIKSEGVEILLAIDVSQSMLAEDVKPSRLDLVKKEVSRFLNLLGGDKVGLLAFAGSSVLLSPMTSDKSALKMYLDSLSTESVETQGTEIDKALSESMDALIRGGDESDERSRVTKVVIVISDGEDHDQGALDQAKLLAKNGIRVFSVAVGTESGGKVPVRDGRGQLRGYLKGPDGQAVLSKVGGKALQEIADAGKGGFYHLTFGGKQMELVKEDIDKLEKSEFDTLLSQKYDEKFQIPLILALILALVEISLGTRKKISKTWKGRFPF